MQKRLTIKNPERLNSKNHLLSGDIVTIKLTAATDEAYYWKISKNYFPPYTFVLDRKIKEDKLNNSLIVDCSVVLDSESIEGCVDVLQLKNRDAFLNEMIEKAKNNFDFDTIKI